MKIRLWEQKDLFREAKLRGVDSSRFSFVKKRGVLHVFLDEKEKPFTFYRKKRSHINEKGQFEEIEEYYRDLPSRGASAISWEGVLEEFEKWLSKS